MFQWIQDLWYRLISHPIPRVINTHNDYEMPFGSNPAEKVCTGCKKRALLVGINKYLTPGNDLNGCINDVEDMYDLLTSKYNFQHDDIRVLNDDRATRDNILTRLRWLIKNTKSGETALYYHSGHGTRVRDRNGDELNDYMDEAIVSYDFDWDDPFTDDMLADVFSNLVPGATLVVLIDTCHSGSMTREFTKPDDQRSVRFLPPRFDIRMRAHGRDLPTQRIGAKYEGSDEQRHILISGCQDDQYSQELMMQGKVRGVMTYYLTQLLRNNNYESWKELHRDLIAAIKSKGFTQDPKISGQDELQNKVPFIG